MSQGYGSETRTMTVNLVLGASSVFISLVVRTHLGDFDILAGQAPLSKVGEYVYVLASIINNGDLEEVCTITCEYPVGTVLWRWSGSLPPGGASSIDSIVIGAATPFIMPTTNAQIRISCTP